MIEMSGSTVGMPVADVVVVYVLDIRRPDAMLRRNRYKDISKTGVRTSTIITAVEERLLSLV